MAVEKGPLIYTGSDKRFCKVKTTMETENMEIGEHFDATSEITLDVVKNKAIKGVAALTGRTVFLQLLGLLATFFLTIFLSPNQFGVFFVVSAVVNFFAYFSDIGLAAALIQKKDLHSRKELETTFTVQNTLVLIVVAIIFLATPLYRQWYHLNQESVYLLWALAFSLLLASLKSIPSVLLERKLDFNKLVIPQIIESVLYQVVAVVLAWRGFGITSFTFAVLVRGVSGLVLMYWLQPWKPGLAFDAGVLKELLRFGLPYQVNTFLAVAKDDGMTAFLGGILGPGNIGLLGWAQKWATAPLRFFMDQVIKVTFPAFSRMQNHQEELSKAVSKSIFFICALVFPSLVVLIFLSPVLVQIIPKYGKWQPALFALSLIAINSAWAAVTTPLTNVLNATGRINITFRLMVMWTVLTWIFIPGLAYLYGLNGAALGYSLVGFSSIIAILIAVRFIPINFWQSVGKPGVASIFMGLVLLLSSRILPISWVAVILLLAIAVLVYAISMFILIGSSLMEDVKRIAIDIRGRS
ncbi:MAG: oligosaccharide flippase family protein [Patescibacteria group bacterium]|nr:oligosaccharide flippase family protein [Patescibacteria group bacterium]